MATGPLCGVRVLDLSRILAGPTCTQLLGDLGAEVIKVERPGRGDDTRAWGPPYLVDDHGVETSESAYYLSSNRNKRSVAIDLGQPDGAALVRRLAADADVLIENFKTGGLDRYGLGYRQLAADYPGLIYCSITGFGHTGPYRARTGYDFLIQGMGGIMSLTGPADGAPTKVGVGIADVVCGLYAATAILAALHRRGASGRGQHIDLALFDSQIAWLINAGLSYLTTGAPPSRHGNGHPNIVPYQVFPAADGHFILAVGNDDQFRPFCAVAGTGWGDDVRFATNAARVRHREQLIPLIEAVTATRPRADWLAALDAAAIPSGPINDLAEVFADPQARHRGMAVTMAHPLGAAGAVTVIGNPIKLSDTPVSYRQAPPLLGEHTDEVLGRLAGLDPAALAQLRARGVIG